MRGASGQSLTNLGQVTATVTADGQTFDQVFIVVPHLEAEKLLLEDDLMTASEALIHWGSNSFSIPPSTKCPKVVLAMEQLLPSLVLETCSGIPAECCPRQGRKSRGDRHEITLRPPFSPC